MTVSQWLAENWFTGLQTLAIFSSFTFTTITLRRDIRSRRVENLFHLTANHRDIWSKTFDQPSLRRVLAPDVNLSREPVTDEELQFVTFVVLHLNSAHQAISKGLIEAPEGLGSDVRTFFANPVPRFVWFKLRPLQDATFVAFVERHFDLS